MPKNRPEDADTHTINGEREMLTQESTACLEEMEIFGVIRPVDWDGLGRVTQVALKPLGNDSSIGEVLISLEGIGWELQACLYEVLRIRGVLSETIHGEKVLHVHSYRFFTNMP